MKFGVLLIAQLATGVVHAAPTVNYAFNQQIPPVARYGIEYHYQVPADTFASPEDKELHYSAKDLPDWLKFDGDSRTLSGTPPAEGDMQDTTLKFKLSAQDDSGSTDDDCTVQLTKEPAPESSSNALLDSLRTAGPTAGSDGLVLKPGEQFKIHFSHDFYHKAKDSNKDITGYAAVNENRSPLPIWCNFNADNMELSGTAPAINSQVAPAQTFGVVLVASDFPGYSSAETKFQLLVGAHQFTANISNESINATSDKEFTYQIPFNRMMLDEQPMKVANVSSISVNSTDWLHVDNSTGKINGKPPKNAKSQVFEIKITDQHNDFLSYMLNVDIDGGSHSVFTTDKLGAVNATQGQFFQYSLKHVLLDDKTKLSAKFDPPANWVKFHADNNTFVGTVPKDFKKTSVTLQALDGSSDEKSSFTLTGVENKMRKKATKTSSSATSSSSSTSSSTPMAAAAKDNKDKDEDKDKQHHKKTVAVACGVSIPIGALAILAALLLCWRRRRDDKKNRHRSISPPILPEQDSDYDVEKSSNANGAAVGAAGGATRGGGGERGGGRSQGGIPPSESKESYNMMWNSPEKVLAMNFMKMDSSHEDVNYYSSEETHVGSPATSRSEEDVLPNTPTGFKSPPARNSDIVGSERSPTAEDIVGRPRGSWRQPEYEGRWQQHKSEGSLATISTDELLTMRLVDRQSTDSHGNAFRNSQNTYMNPTQSRILTPRESMVRDESSGNVKQIGSHSSSLTNTPSTVIPPGESTIGTYSSTNDDDNNEYSTSYHQQRALNPVQEERSVDYDNENVDYYRNNPSQRSFRSEFDFDEHDLYRTASSGSDFESGKSSSDQENEMIRPYRNSRGEMTWSQVDLYNKAQQASTPENDRYSFVPHSDFTGQSNIDTVARSSGNTLRLVDPPGRHTGHAQTPDQSTIASSSNSPKIQQSSSAEIAFL